MVRVAHSGRSVGDYFLTLLAAIGVLLLVAVVIATYFYLQTPVCVDACSVSSCSGSDYVECAVQPDGCLAPVSLGTVLGQCDAECLTDAHCGDGDASSVDVVCSAQNRCVIPASLGQLAAPAVVRRAPTPVVAAPVVDSCGNSQVDILETCGTCPSDVACPTGTSCRFSSCERVGLTSTTGVVYCGYERGSYEHDSAGINVAKSALSTFSSCGTAAGLVDNVYTSSETRWVCSGITFPQWAAVELPEELIINRVRILNSYMSDHDFALGDVNMYYSVDSTNGRDGHWMQVASGQRVPEDYTSSLDIFTDPISTKWVKIEVLSTRGASGHQFGMAELLAYEADFLCESDYEGEI